MTKSSKKRVTLSKVTTSNEYKTREQCRSNYIEKYNNTLNDLA